MGKRKRTNKDLENHLNPGVNSGAPEG